VGILVKSTKNLILVDILVKTLLVVAILVKTRYTAQAASQWEFPAPSEASVAALGEASVAALRELDVAALRELAEPEGTRSRKPSLRDLGIDRDSDRGSLQRSVKKDQPEKSVLHYTLPNSLIFNTLFFQTPLY
jgi:hypothetical protein